ncbi:uncharacterized protein ACNS7B_017472 [Menidia menidia]
MGHLRMNLGHPHCSPPTINMTGDLFMLFPPDGSWHRLQDPQSLTKNKKHQQILRSLKIDVSRGGDVSKLWNDCDNMTVSTANSVSGPIAVDQAMKYSSKIPKCMS